MKNIAEQKLIENMSYINRIVDQIVIKNGGNNKLFDMDDMYQESYITFLEACDKYDESKGATLITFAARLIHHRIAEILRKKSITNSYITDSLERLEEVTCSNQGYVDITFERAENNAILSQIDKELQALYNRTTSKTYRYGIMALRYDILGEMNNVPCERKDLADKLGTTTRYLSVCVQRVKDAYYNDILAKIMGNVPTEDEFQETVENICCEDEFFEDSFLAVAEEIVECEQITLFDLFDMSA